MEGQDSVVKQQHEEMLYPAMRVRSERAGGSGTVIHSGQDQSGKFRTIILTNHHVIEGAIEVKEVWDPKVGKKIKREFRAKVKAEYFRYNNLSRNTSSDAVDADIVAYDAQMDLALLELRELERPALHIAKLIPEDKISECHLLDEVFAVGAALGHAPIVTDGRINHMDDEIDHYNYWLSSAQIIFGNSGGAIYRKRDGHYELLGVPSRVSVSMSGFSSQAITHMGFFAPPDRIYKFLEDNDFQFIFDPEESYEECKSRRDRKKKLAQKLLEMQLGRMEDAEESFEPDPDNFGETE